VEALPAGDVVTVERWCELPGFTVDRFRKIVLETRDRGTLVASVRYWERPVLEAFRPLAVPPPVRRPRLLSERTWEGYVAHYTVHYGPPDARIGMDLWFRYNSERETLGLPIEEKWYEEPDPLSRLRDGEPLDDPLPLAA
jgi:hypothetical protein